MKTRAPKKGGKKRFRRILAVVLITTAAFLLLLARTVRLTGPANYRGPRGNDFSASALAREIEETRAAMEARGMLPGEISEVLAPLRRLAPEEIPAVLEEIRSRLDRGGP